MKIIQLNLIIGFYFLFAFSPISGQQTIGLFENDSNSFQGYTLISPILSNDSYLIDNCGELIHKWESDSRPGLMAYLTDDGSLVRTERISSNFGAGGSGGRISRYDWDNNLTWRFDISAEKFHQHHDIALLPNGNILVLAWEVFSRDDIIAAGRDPEIVLSPLWLEKIIELKPIGEDEAEEVWSWHLIDHLVQDIDSTKANHGVVADHPEKMNINFDGGGLNPVVNSLDWVHFNSIDYNPELDQILVSSRHMSEIYIIDHSTTTEEAATSSGGIAGKGGDFLYRWGNPESYNRGNVKDQRSFLQHDATWIKFGDQQKWGFSFFNNGVGRAGPDFSQVDMVVLPLIPNRRYFIEPNEAYGPTNSNLTINEIEGELFFHHNISGAEILPNGNALICVGSLGVLSEIDTSSLERVWHYVIPIKGEEPMIQGNLASGNNAFKVRRYAPDHPAFEDRVLIPQGPLELDPLPQECIIFSSNNNVTPINEKIHVYPNPSSGELFVESTSEKQEPIEIYNPSGILIAKDDFFKNMSFDLRHLPNGMYILKVGHNIEKLLIQNF